MEFNEYFKEARSYYTFVKKKTKKTQCKISVVSDNNEIKHTIMDGLLFDGANVIDGLDETRDGLIEIKENQIYFEGCEKKDLEYTKFLRNPNGSITKK